MSLNLDGVSPEVLEEYCRKLRSECINSSFVRRAPQDFYAFEVLYISDGKLFHSRGDIFHPVLLDAFNKTRLAVEREVKIFPYSIEQLCIKSNKPELFRDATCRILSIGFPTDIKKLFKEFVVLREEALKTGKPTSASDSSLYADLQKSIEVRFKKIEETCLSLQYSVNQISDALGRLTEKVESIDASKVISSSLITTTNHKRSGDLLTLNFIRRALIFEDGRWGKEVDNFNSTHLDPIQLKKLKSSLRDVTFTPNTATFFHNIFEIICDKEIAASCRFPSFDYSGQNKTHFNNSRDEIPEKELNKILDFLKIFDFVNEDNGAPNIFRTLEGWNVVKNRYNRWGLKLKETLKTPKRVLEVEEEQPPETFISYDIICDDEIAGTSNSQDISTNTEAVTEQPPSVKATRTYSRSSPRNKPKE